MVASSKATSSRRWSGSGRKACRIALGRPDTIENAVALCPNRYRRMHALDLVAARKRLLSRIAARLTPAAAS